MTGKFKSSANTAHSPKSQFYEEWSKLFLENDVEKIIEPLDSEIEWEMVGESTMKGIDEIKKSFFNDNQGPDIKMTLMDIENIISHGKFVSAWGTMEMSNREKYRFSDILEFKSHKSDSKVIKIIAFVVKI